MLIGSRHLFSVTSPALERHTMSVQDGIIVEIRPTIPSDPVVENSCLLPGFINSHTHLAYTGLRNLFDQLSFFSWIRKLTETKYEKLTDEHFKIFTKLGITEMLRAGITTVADMCDCEAALRELASSSLRAIFYWEVFGVEVEQAEYSWADLQRKIPYFRDQYSSSKLTIGLSPHASYTVRPELYGKIANWATRHEIPISFHAAESKEEEEFICYRTGPIAEFLHSRAADWKMLGSSSISHLAATGILDTRPLLAHAIQLSESDMEILHARKVSIAHCPKSNAKFGHGVAPIVDLLEKNVTVGLGTDGAISNNRFDMFEECRFALLNQRARYQKFVLSEEDMLRMATIEGAKALGMANDIGSLEVGKRADFILVKVPPHYTTSEQVLHHIIHNATSADVLRVYINGNELNLRDLDLEIIDLEDQLRLHEVGE